ncbi:PP2C family protein-serine/threonine phosphatase [Streptomyces sp. NPDC002888]|uniref:PP2C family protein-serine/threonine phosphatase n=1 Tax=Streptomyces sp. NPDC002888 TaxID=3364668 RepID=UPI00369EEB3D
MTAVPDSWKISSAADAALARTTVARLTADADVPLLERARFLTALTAGLRRCLDQGGTWELALTADEPAVDTDGQLNVTLRPIGHSQRRTPPAEFTLACPRPLPPPTAGPDRAELADGVLAADKDTAAVLDRLDETEELLRLHRDELHQTNQGVLALHAELDAAALAERELLDAERAARAQAENARSVLTFLADASAAVTASLDRETILRRLPELLVPEYADHVDVWLFDDERTPGNGGRPAATVTAARTGHPQHAAAHPGDLPGVDDLPASVLSPTRPLLCIPLTAHRMLGVLTLTAPGPRFDPDASVMLIELARRTAIALDNARRYEQHRDTAEALQRAQLTDLPTAEGLLLAARYLPATRGLNIGGDWYDAFEQPDGSLLAVIGDVTGHGLRAAVMMGQLRTALRAYAVEGDSPGRILTRLHHMLCHQQPELYATAVIARFRPGDPEVVWAAAGHPPLVVRTPNGAVRVVEAKPGIMLGVPVPYQYEDHALALPPGSTVALYTDGLVERRAEGIDPGIDRLAHTLAGFGTAELEQDLDASAESLLKPMLHGSERDDDVCLLLCHTTPVAEPADAPHSTSVEPAEPAAGGGTPPS